MSQKQITIADLALGKLQESIEILPKDTKEQVQAIKDKRRLIRLTKDGDAE